MVYENPRPSGQAPTRRPAPEEAKRYRQKSIAEDAVYWSRRKQAEKTEIVISFVIFTIVVVLIAAALIAG